MRRVIRSRQDRNARPSQDPLSCSSVSRAQYAPLVTSFWACRSGPRRHIDARFGEPHKPTGLTARRPRRAAHRLPPDVAGALYERRWNTRRRSHWRSKSASRGGPGGAPRKAVRGLAGSGRSPSQTPQAPWSARHPRWSRTWRFVAQSPTFDLSRRASIRSSRKTRRRLVGVTDVPSMKVILQGYQRRARDARSMKW